MMSFQKYTLLSFTYAVMLLFIFLVEVKNGEAVFLFFLVWFILSVLTFMYSIYRSVPVFWCWVALAFQFPNFLGTLYLSIALELNVFGFSDNFVLPHVRVATIGFLIHVFINTILYFLLPRKENFDTYTNENSTP